jgi:type VI secretion system secreted protein VgrG
MMARYTQDDRPLRLDTVLGTDELLLSAVSGAEAISQLYCFKLEAFSEKPDIDPAAILRTAARVTVRGSDGEARFFSGIVNRFTQLGSRDDLFSYALELVPWLWFLTLTRQSRIFQNTSVLGIIEEIFRGHGFADYELRTRRSYPEREYVVQYRETDFNFVSRLMELEGIFYFFEHSEKGHLLVITDDNSACRTTPGAEAIRFVPEGRGGESVITALVRENRVHPGRVTLRDYDYLKPSARLAAELGDAAEEIYDYPGFYRVRAGAIELEEGERLARLLLEAEEVERQVLRGVSDAPLFTPGCKFGVSDRSRFNANGSYILTHVSHTAGAGDYRAWETTSDVTYSNSFTCIPEAVPYRPPRRASRPLIHGSQTALVVGPPGEEVYTDRYGRVKVQFHWDRVGSRDENSSCWVRVATPWGGKGYGSVSIPRIGNEVVVAYEEGDPDRPLIVGSVYNAEQTVPYELPGAGIQMGMHSRSSPGGGGSNAITMTDTKGKELINIHAQYDMVTVVDNDQTTTVHNNRTSTVDVDDTTTVSANQKLTVAGNREVTVSGDRTTSVGGSDALSVGGDRSVSAGGAMSLSAGGDLTAGAGGAMGLSSGSDTTVSASANLEASAGAKATLSAGAEISIEAGATIKLSAGGSSIEIGPAGITITSGAIVSVTGAIVKVNG